MSQIIKIKRNKKTVVSNKIHKLIASTLVQMTIDSNIHYDLEFFSQFYADFKFWEMSPEYCRETGLAFAGVNVDKRGMNFFYNPDGLKTLSSGHLRFLLIHEVMHILNHHNLRTSELSTNKTFQRLSNFVQDAIINSDIIKHGTNENGEAIYNFGTFIKGGILVPNKYNKENNSKKWYYEALLNWFIDNKLKIQPINNEENLSKEEPLQNNGNENNSNSDLNNLKKDKHNISCDNQNKDSSNGEQQQNNQELDKNDIFNDIDEWNKNNTIDINKTSDTWKKENSMFDNAEPPQNNQKPYLDYNDDDYKVNQKIQRVFFDSHIEMEATAEEVNDIIIDQLESMKMRGIKGCDYEYWLNKLSKTKSDYTKKVKRAIELMIGSKNQSTWKRKNRRHDSLKGKIKKSGEINIILDTSGSMDGEFEYVLSFLFKKNVVINMIQIDTEIKSHTKITNSNELQKTMIKGLGGTTLNPAIEYIHQNKMNYCGTLIITDGYTDKLTTSLLHSQSAILTTSDSPEVDSNIKIYKVSKKYLYGTESDSVG